MKTNKYVAISPSGAKHRFTVPSIWDGHAVAEKMQHSLVFMYIPRGSSIFVENHFQTRGPTWVMFDHGKIWDVNEEPRDDKHALELWRRTAGFAMQA